jgi:hypothetical protein
MKKSNIISRLSLGAVVLATTWLVFSSVTIGKDLFRKDGLVTMRASDGATVQVKDRVPVLLSSGTVLSGKEWHVALIPALAVPFALLVAFAVRGSFSLSPQQERPTSTTAQP